MSDEKKKPEGETPEEKKPDTPPEDKPTEPPKEEPKAEDGEKPKEEPQTEEKGEGEKLSDEPEKPPENPAEDIAESETAPPELSNEDKLKEENFRLKTQLEAVKIGFIPDVIEDAVILAENIVKKDGSDIAKALQAVAKKYPDWKADSKGKGDNSKGGFKVGADSSKQTSANDDKIRQAFGLKSKK